MVVKRVETPYVLVIPVYKERLNVVPLAQEIHAVMKKLKKPYALVFVDDGSRDGTLQALETIKNIHIVALRKNSGQSLALKAGLDYALDTLGAQIIITMDGDRQNDPRDIPRLLAKLNEGYDAVSGWRYKRKDSLMKHIVSRMMNRVRHFFINDHLHDAGCSLKAYTKDCFEDFELYGEFHRYIAEMINIKGFSIAEVKVHHRPRKAGKTKYDNVVRGMKGLLDLLMVWFWQKYANRPLHLFGGAGIASFGLGVLVFLFTIYQKLFLHVDMSETFLSVIGIFFIIVGMQLVIAGMMFDLVLRTYNKDKKRYSVKKIVVNV